VIVDRLDHRVSDGRYELSARIRPERGAERRLWFRFPEAFAPAGPPDASPFLVALVAWSMRHGEDLELEAPVSPSLLGASREIVSVYQSLRPAEMREVAISAPEGEPPAPNEITACYFTRGADSWFAVLTALEDEPHTPPLTHAVFSPDFLSEECDDAYVRNAVAGARRAAESLGLEVIHAETNVRREVRGAHLAATALALGPRRMLIPSGAMRGEITPAGTHPALDHRFSIERTQVVHFGDASRLAKVRRISRSELALHDLRVCRVEDVEDDRNCCRCEKCVRTMVELHIAGSLERSRSFDLPLTPEAVARLMLRLTRRHQWIDALHSLGSSRFDRRIAAAIRMVVTRSDLLSAFDQAKALAVDPEAASLGRGLLPLARRTRDLSWLLHRLLGGSVGAWLADAGGLRVAARRTRDQLRANGGRRRNGSDPPRIKIAPRSEVADGGPSAPAEPERAWDPYPR
jgi:hypothetical protein